MIEDATQYVPQGRGILFLQLTTEKGVYGANQQMEYRKAPSSKGFPVKFYHKFWVVVNGYK
jgi:hypothetical protein